MRLRSKAVSNFNQVMDSNSDSVPPNDQLPNSMPMLPNPVPQDSQEDKEKLALKQFWDKQLIDIESGEAFMHKRHLSPTRIKKLMKADEDIKVVISSEAPLVFAKACEMFIQELAIRAWTRAEAENRNTLELCDVAMAIKSDGIFDFLADVVDCGHNHDVDIPTKEGHAGNKGNQASETHTAGFKENTMMTMGEKVASNQLFPQPQMMHPPHLPSDKAKMKQPLCQFTYPHMMNQSPNFPSNHS